MKKDGGIFLSYFSGDSHYQCECLHAALKTLVPPPKVILDHEMDASFHESASALGIKRALLATIEDCRGLLLVTGGKWSAKMILDELRDSECDVRKEILEARRCKVPIYLVTFNEDRFKKPFPDDFPAELVDALDHPADYYRVVARYSDLADVAKHIRQAIVPTDQYADDTDPVEASTKEVAALNRDREKREVVKALTESIRAVAIAADDKDLPVAFAVKVGGAIEGRWGNEGEARSDVGFSRALVRQLPWEKYAAMAHDEVDRKRVLLQLIDAALCKNDHDKKSELDVPTVADLQNVFRGNDSPRVFWASTGRAGKQHGDLINEWLSTWQEILAHEKSKRVISLLFVARVGGTRESILKTASGDYLTRLRTEGLGPISLDDFNNFVSKAGVAGGDLSQHPQVKKVRLKLFWMGLLPQRRLKPVKAELGPILTQARSKRRVFECP